MRYHVGIGVLLGALGTLTVACGSHVETTSEDSQDLQSLKFVELDVVASSAPDGLKVIKTAEKFEEFFGEAPPSDVNFNKHWVITAGMGTQTSGGYAIEVTRVHKKTVNGEKQLVIDTTATSPGEGCIATAAMTNPQITVRVSKPAGNPWVQEARTELVTDCGSSASGEEGASCGGFTVSGSPGCNEGLFCNYTAEAQCGAADQPGVCLAIADFAICPKVIKPVCGCDGNTYTNGCIARGQGVSVAKAGACEDAPNDGLGEGESCGGFVPAGTPTTCAEGLYCAYALEDQCGAADAPGVCETIPSGLCPMVIKPVCGCNGKTYTNSCKAAHAGTSVAHKGSCVTP